MADKDERDYYYGVIPRALLGLRLLVDDRAMLEATGRYYYVTGAGAGTATHANRAGQEHIARVHVGGTVRVYGPHALGL